MGSCILLALDSAVHVERSSRSPPEAGPVDVLCFERFQDIGRISEMIGVGMTDHREVDHLTLNDLTGGVDTAIAQPVAGVVHHVVGATSGAWHLSDRAESGTDIDDSNSEPGRARDATSEIVATTRPLSQAIAGLLR